MLSNFFDLPYVRWHILFVFIPSVLIWLFNYKYLLKFKRTFIFITVFSFIWGLLFDLRASVQYNLWFFNKTHNLGIWFLGLPIEEYIFLLFVPQGITAIFLLMRKAINRGR